MLEQQEDHDPGDHAGDRERQEGRPEPGPARVVRVERHDVLHHGPARTGRRRPAGAAVTTAFFSLVPGYALQRILTGSPDKETYMRGVRELLNR
ncbi:hypothetical protein [Actinoplanes sp. NPDC048796]|uniref:hypothetical protein n=1 Tax=Actinoplanes sp. NPDC048796 TaxID=3155640 RepID=UPI0033C130E9